MKERFEETGPLASVDVLSAVAAVARDAGSGTLRATGPGGHAVAFGFETGALVALEPPPECGPAEVLIRAGKVQRTTYEALTVGDFEDRFAIAAASGVISRREVNWGLKLSAIESLVRLLSWSEGAYVWEEEVSPTAPSIRLPISQWVLELFLRSNDRGFVVRRIGPTDVPVARSEGFAGEFAALGLTADADAVVEGIDGRRTIDEICKRSRSDEFATLKLLAALITLGMVRPIHEIPETEKTGEIPANPIPADRPTLESLLPDGGFEPAAAPEPTPASRRTEKEEKEPATEITDTELPAEFELARVPEPAPLESSPAWPDEDEEASVEDSFPEEPAPPPEPEPEPEVSPVLLDVPPEPAIVADAPEVSVPLFALTAPEAPGEPEIGGDSVAPERPDPRRRFGAIRAVAVLAALAIAGILVWSRPRPTPEPAPVAPAPSTAAPTNAPGPRPSPPPKETPNAEHEIVIAAPPPSAAAPPHKVAGEPRKPERSAAEPRAAHVPPAKDSIARSSTAVPGHGAHSSSESWEVLARAGRQAFEHPGANRYAIQLELACEETTLKKAFDTDPSGHRIWIAPYSFRDRSCYRVLWGKYRDLASARAAKGSIPDVFSRDGNRPTVVPLGTHAP